MLVRDAKPGDVIEVKCGKYYGPAQYTICSRQDYPNRVRAYWGGSNVSYLFPDNECRVIEGDTERYEAYCQDAARGNDDRR